MNATVRRLPRQDKFRAKAQHFVVEMLGEEIGVLAKYPRQPWTASLIRSPREIGQFKTKVEATRAVMAKFTPDEIVMMRFSRFAPEFQAKITALAEYAGKTTEAVAGWWMEYARACSGDGGQSTIFSEFVRWYRMQLFGSDADAPVNAALDELDARWM